MSTTTQQTETVEIDFAAIDILINTNQCKVSVLARQMGVSAQDLRNALVEHYGQRIIFKRGRSGGVYWNAVSPT